MQNALHNLYVRELRDIYDAERQLLRGRPNMARAADADELKSALDQQLRATSEQIKHLEKVFMDMQMSPKGKTCHGMEGMIAEGNEMIREAGENQELDAALIAAAQCMMHYGIAS